MACPRFIRDSVEELCEECFFECKTLSYVTFGESPSLRLIEKEAFRGSGVVEIHIPTRFTTAERELRKE